MAHPTRRHRWRLGLVGLSLLGTLGAAGVSGSAGAAAEQPDPLRPPIRPLPPPSHFVDTVDNPLLPLRPGTIWIYRGGSHGEEHIRVRVLHRTRQIEGITATVVKDVARVDGKVTEATRDWFAQDCAGNVWYLGEATKAYDHGHVSTEGSWETGVDGGKAGIAMLAQPEAGDRYRQEYLAGTAEDVGRVLDLRTKVTVPVGHFRHVLMTKDTTLLEPSAVELKFYAPGIGSVREIDLSPEQGSTDLVRMVRPDDKGVSR